jgi:hypothetical protein
MSSLDINSMRDYLSRSISSINQNKAYGMVAEIDLRNKLIELGYGDRISQGGWIIRNVGNNLFGHFTSVLFPMTIIPGNGYAIERILEEPPLGLHTICSTMHQIGVHSFYCVPSIAANNNCDSITWHIKQLGIPVPPPYSSLNDTIANFSLRGRRYNFLRYHTNSQIIPEASIPEEFTKEHLRISFQNHFMSEMSDVDGVFWGQQFTYPLEIKEKTVAPDKSNKTGPYFGLDVGPFVKLAFYAAKKATLHSIFIVREIDNVQDRNLVNWWFITFDIIAQFASWIPQGGGRNMQGGGSTVVKIPKSEFKELNAANLALL